MNKKRLFASAMAACMLLSTMPGTALAAEASPDAPAAVVSTEAGAVSTEAGVVSTDETNTVDATNNDPGGNAGDISQGTEGEGSGCGGTCIHQAAIGETHYDTVQAAIDAAGTDETEIDVLYDIRADTRVVTIKDDQNITLDLNGHTITSSYNNYTIAVQTPDDKAFGNGTATTGKLTIIGNGTIENTSAGSSTIRNYGTLTIGRDGDTEFPTITRGTTTNGAGNSAVKCDETATLTIYGGTFNGDKRSIQSFGQTTIAGGTFLKTVEVWKYQNYDSILTIKDGKFKGVVQSRTGAEGGDYAGMPTLSIEGGYFTSNPNDKYLANGYVVVDSDLPDYMYKVVNEVSTYTVSFKIGDSVYSVSADTITFEKAATELDDALNAYAGSTFVFKGWKLSGTGNFATGQIPAPTAPGTTYVAVFEKKADSSDVAVTPAPSVGDTYVIVPDTIPTEYKTVVENAVKDVGVTELNNLAGDMAKNITGDEKNQAKTALADKGITLGDDDSVTIHVQTYLNVKATDYQQSENGSVTLTLDITPMFQMIASTADNKADIDLEGDDRNSVVMDSGALKITQPVTVTIPLPANCGVADGSVVYVKHIAQENKVYIYTATVTDGKITFPNPHGFSKFTITSENPAAAKIGETFYATLQDAVNAVQDNGTITVLKSETTPVIVNRVVNFTVENGSAAIVTYEIKAGSNVTITKTTVDGGVKYTFTASAPSYPGGGNSSGGNSSGGNSSGGNSGSGNSSSSNSSYAVSVPSRVENGSVSVSPKNAAKGSTVTLTVTPDKGYELGTLTVTDKDGNKLVLTDKGNGKFSFTMPASKVNIKATFVETVAAPETPVNPFYDVAETDYFFDAVLWANENGITSGVGSGKFAPNATCTRAQMVTFLWNAAGCPNVSADHGSFIDVAASDYYYKAVLWAKANNITSGTAEGVFSPDQICNRAQMATFLYKFAEGKAVGTSNRFADVTASDYYAQPVQWAVENGITSGTGANTFGPADPCTRAQMVTFLYRLLAD